MKLITKASVVAQVSDIALTSVGLAVLPVQELNPNGFATTLFCKLLVIGLLVFLFERLTFPKIAWIIPIIAMIPVLWNMLVILSEMYLH